MTIVKYLRNLLIIILLAYLVVITSKNAQIYLLYKMNSLGSGWDDGAVQMFIENKAGYKNLILDMLNSNKMSSYEINVTFTFADLLKDDEDIYNKLKDISENYPKKHVRCFWHDVLNGRFEQKPILQKQLGESASKFAQKELGVSANKFVAYQLVDNGTKCE
ncbi:hypothetical protein [Pseudoalteromonas obscura]|uniref:Uncharacterized protein n=1 Tax=Pseudoalteromonas obscura TaxID=3048491 RepID=A0ABT7EPF8_9GAMM|nr:hypothetical protein [Pseudoalteromonas sp. P94(2023)]MDK2596922.1 hypothetical protein [Pseudoalteromonas sp. P94(2023)]